jgi:hypothetical protein
VHPPAPAPPIAVDANESTVGRRALEDGGGVPAKPNRGVAVHTADGRRKERHRLVQENGRVAGVTGKFGGHWIFEVSLQSAGSVRLRVPIPSVTDPKQHCL